MASPILLDLPVPIRTPRLLIRHTLPGDGPEFNRAIDESFADLTQWMLWAQQKQSLQESETFARRSYAKWISREDMTLPIFDSNGKTQIGCTGLHSVNWACPSFEIGYWVRSSKRGNGYITEAVNVVTQYAFQVLKAKRVEIRCDADNVRSSRVAERLGFELDGKLRQDFPKCYGQGLRDTLVFSRVDLDGLPALDVKWGDR